MTQRRPTKEQLDPVVKAAKAFVKANESRAATSTLATLNEELTLFELRYVLDGLVKNLGINPKTLR